MTDGTFPDRVVQLRSRWEADPTSRIFLQLAEEYRHLGRVKEALEVLEKGLKEHPGYLSALVAKGRCYLELGEPQLARGVLERVVKQDPTQMVANKLLVRAYLETGEPGQARERLDLYSLLNDSDPEIEELRRRIKAAERPAPPPPPPPPPIAEPELLEADVFDLGAGAAPVPPPRAVADVFELDVPARATAHEPEPEPELRPLAVVPTAPDPFAAAAEAPVIESGGELGDGDLFPGLTSRASQQRYLAGLAAEGIFQFEAPPAPERIAEPVAIPEPVFELPPVIPEAAAPPAAEPPRFMAWADPAPFAELAEPAFPAVEPPVFPEATPLDLETPGAPPWEPVPAPAFFEPEPLPVEDLEPPVYAEPEIEPEMEPEMEIDEAEQAPETAAPAALPATPATMTLGELYLRQGHLQEAGRIFREILQRKPDHAAALEGLEQVGRAQAARGHRPLAASELLDGFDPDRADGGPNARKAFLLNSYLARLRRGRRRDVS